MEPCTSSLHFMTHPLTAFREIDVVSSKAISWELSSLNPKNRVDKIRPESSWRIDGVDVDGTRFHVVPSFAVSRPPMRIDLLIPDHENHPGALRTTLQTASPMTFRGKRRLEALDFCRYLASSLQSWSESIRDFETVYWDLPFGSSIVLSQLGTTQEAQNLCIDFSLNYKVEQQLLSVAALQDLWGFDRSSWPMVLDISQLHLVRQPHDAISLVTIDGCGEGELMVFKSLTQDIRFLYHELRILLSMPPHPNIIGRPKYIVTKLCRFGAKRGVCGFILDYYPDGTLRDALWDEARAMRLPPHVQSAKTSTMMGLSTRSRLAREFASALVHIAENPSTTGGFFTGTKTANVVLDCGGGRSRREPRVVVIDFEQRTGQPTWNPPEIMHVQILELLASSSSSPSITPTSSTESTGVAAKYASLLQSYIPGWKSLYATEPVRRTTGNVSSVGYSRPWIALSPEQREAAQVFMLGKLLWCLFESVGSIDSSRNLETFAEPSWCDQEFPEFRRTPIPLREWIRSCTAGAPEWGGRFPALQKREDGRLYARDSNSCLRGPRFVDGEDQTPREEAEKTAVAWWKGQVEESTKFLEYRLRQARGIDDGVEAPAQYEAWRTRPTLKTVLRVLEDFERSLNGNS
ncbi:hypothetical protein B0T16DRAFT_458909 [Cercophora newfieldiana]|uniref:Protein kinase domain-containing protein n=1 Tax=Cercophora newfieldiana TaxID=92897 RepID=A0AA40CQ68_9PEZI|nr:hypothetical protein B0T16DRAFT_458909 [Cercophora newfieldiana]